MSKDAAHVGGFEELFAAESKWRLEHGDPEALEAERVTPASKPHFHVSKAGSAEAPRVIATQEDCVGVAFSGGGIRSATFNLGLLQGLNRLKFLQHVDYLSTVSGGGYIGAWWSAWLARRELAAEPQTETIFPEPRPVGTDSVPAPAAEAEEVRHLREFSNFLAPRIGFFKTEMWSALLAVMSAMLPALAVALAIVALAFLVWLGAACLMLPPQAKGPAIDPVGGAFAAAFAIGVLGLAQLKLEWWWRGEAKAENPADAWWSRAALVALIATAGMWLLIEWAGWLAWAPEAFGGTANRFGLHLYAGRAFQFDPHLFHAPLAWAGAAVLLFLPRIVIMRFYRGARSDGAKITADPMLPRIAAVDRVLQRMLATAAVWAVVCALWLAGAYLHHIDWGTAPVASGAVASAGLFAWLRNWIATQLTSQKTGSLLDALKPLLPQLLAFLAVVLTAICVAAGLASGFERFGDVPFSIAAAITTVGIILFAIVCFDPAMVSLHAFYRNRLARAYLGASNKDALGKETSSNRYVDLRDHDDLAMRDLLPQRLGKKRGPLHLVCCAANDVGGDQLGNLARASRSAVLSPLGFAINDSWRGWRKEPSASATSIDRLTLSSAITASAAAFNSNMGSISASLGTLVCFLMSALNLRLGLWLPHPRNPEDDLGKFPGSLFLREMFGLTKCGLKDRQPVAPYVHLSDGAHFENLALYELVRRHCRYIIVSDCGADSTVAFEDFGNAARRIREDFGIQIEIDLSPLKPDPLTNISRQHMVVGSIYYDRELTDVGMLLYIKPTLTGDEPGDVIQYRTANAQFPHESTGDQFYDEAQWESYRRLGEHAIEQALRFLQHQAAAQARALDSFQPRDIFVGARQEWYPAPADLALRVAEAGERVAALETRMRGLDLPELVHQLFPEIDAIAKALKSPPSKRAKPSLAQQLESHLPVIAEMFCVMEKIWLSCHLETHRNHPMNLGLMNLFQRWAYGPSARLWWPFLRSLHSAGFRRFMGEHLSLRDTNYPQFQPYVEGPLKAMRQGLAELHWRRTHESETTKALGTWRFYEYRLLAQAQEDGSSTQTPVDVQFGLAKIDHRGADGWMDPDHFFIPPGFWGAAAGGEFLKQLQKKLPPEMRCLRVTLDRVMQRDVASRQERSDLVAFYKRAGFQEDAESRQLVWTRPDHDAESPGQLPIPTPPKKRVEKGRPVT